MSEKQNYGSLLRLQILILAVDGGYDAVAIVNGEQSAARYDLSKEIHALSFAPSANACEPGWLQAWDREDNRILDSDVLQANLDDHIGKELAARLLAAPMQNGQHSLLGEDVKVGGEGMKTFYDQFVPQAINKLLSKIGAESMEVIQIEGGQEGKGGLPSSESSLMLHQPGFKITDKVRAAVIAGLPLF